MFKNTKQELLIEELSSIRTIIEKNISVKNDKEVMSQKSQDLEENIESIIDEHVKSVFGDRVGN